MRREEGCYTITFRPILSFETAFRTIEPRNESEMVTRTNRRSRPAARRGKVARGLATPLFLLGMLLLSAYSAFAQDDAGATEVMDTASLIVGDIRAPVYVDEDGNFVEADTNKYSETYMPSCSQVCAKLPGGATSGSAADCKLRKQLYNQLIELRGNIRVFCRVRPLFGKEISEEEEDVTRFPEEDEITVLASDGSYSRAKTYEFDKVFEPDVGQTGVFEEVAPLIASVLDGYNFWIFAYGQTGRGKTYTMEGPREVSSSSAGLVLVLQMWFSNIDEKLLFSFSRLIVSAGSWSERARHL